MTQFVEKTEPIGENAETCAEEACTCPKEARKEAVNEMKKNLIMDAAQRVIAREGYLNARLENIAEEAGFSKASIYHYFSDKEALFAHMAIREMKADYHKCLDVVKKGLPFVEVVRTFVATFFDNDVLESDNPQMFDMANVLLATTKHEDLISEVTKYKMGMFLLLKQAVEKARADGVLDIPVNDYAVAGLITSFTNSATMTRSIIPKASVENMNGMSNYAELIDTFKKVSAEGVFNSLYVFLKPYIRESN